MMLFADKKDIFELVDKFDKSSLSELEISTGGEFHMKLSKQSKMSGFESRDVEVTENIEISDDLCDLKFIKAPLVGTFYSSPSPESDAYVKLGDKVTKGMTVCIIEAMKTMNEIESEFDGEVVEILADNNSPVEYGQPLFRVE